MRLNEGELITPVFGGSEEANGLAMSIWADFVKALSTIDKEFLGDKGDASIAKSLFKGMVDEATRRLESAGTEQDKPEDKPEDQPVQPADEKPADPAATAGAPAVAAPDVSAEEKAKFPADSDWAVKQESIAMSDAELRRWRTIAGIPHPDNYL